MAVEFEVKGSRTSEYRFLPEQLEFADDLARHVIKDDLTFEKMEALAKKYLELRGIAL